MMSRSFVARRFARLGAPLSPHNWIRLGKWLRHSLGDAISSTFRALFEGLTLALFGWWLIPFAKRYSGFKNRFARHMPNVISGLRLVAAIVVSGCLVGFYATGDHNHAKLMFWCLVGVAFLDAIDGPLARHLHATSELGKGLDPLADKTLFFCGAGTFCVVSWWQLPTLPAMVLSLQAAFLIIAYEIPLMHVAMQTRHFGHKLGYDLDHDDQFGANHYGKSKFNVEMFAAGLGWATLLYRPSALGDVVVLLAVLLSVAIAYAAKSLDVHRRQRDELVRRYALSVGMPTVGVNANSQT